MKNLIRKYIYNNVSKYPNPKDLINNSPYGLAATEAQVRQMIIEGSIIFTADRKLVKKEQLRRGY